jgi:hypothetical protein
VGDESSLSGWEPRQSQCVPHRLKQGDGSLDRGEIALLSSPSMAATPAAAKTRSARSAGSSASTGTQAAPAARTPRIATYRSADPKASGLPRGRPPPHRRPRAAWQRLPSPTSGRGRSGQRAHHQPPALRDSWSPSTPRPRRACAHAACSKRAQECSRGHHEARPRLPPDAAPLRITTHV